MATPMPNFSDSLEELRGRLVWRLSFLLIGFGIGATWYLLVRRDVPFAACILPFSLILFSWAIETIANDNPRLARHLFVWGGVAHLLVAMLIFPAAWLPFLGILCVFVSAMLINNGSLFTAASLFGAALILNLVGIRAYPLLGLTVTLGLAATSSWLCAYTLFTVVHWYSAMQVHTQQLLEVTRDHRAELSQTLKSLEAAYATQKHIQLELIWARKHADDARRLKEQFAANISHELRTPLSLILGFSETMYLAPEVYGNVVWPPTLRRDIHQIYLSSKHLLALIDDILDLSRFEMTGFDITLEAVPLAELLADTVEIARDLVRGRPVHLDLAIPTDLPIVELDRTRIRQVILNLLNNACRFTEAGAVELAARQRDHEVEISVSDTGSGIPDDKLPYLFDEFYQADHSLKRTHGGVGLGLAISKRFIEAHGGRIWVETREGAGSCFTFTLPLTERLDSHPQPAPTGSSTPAETARPCVLVIDKDAAVVAMLQRHLSGCDLVQVHDPESLSDLIVTCHPRAVVCNTRPGHQMADYPELERTSVPIIECSLPSQAWAAENLPLVGCLTTPITSPALLAEIKRIGHVRHILLIAHNRGFALLIERLLQAASVTTLDIQRTYTAAEGLTALSIRRPDLILLDSMILETDSPNLHHRLEQEIRHSGMPVVLLTTNPTVEAVPRAPQFVVRHADGLYPIETLNFLNQTIHHLKPRYYAPAVGAPA